MAARYCKDFARSRCVSIIRLIVTKLEPWECEAVRFLSKALLLLFFVPALTHASLESDKCRALIPQIICEVEPPAHETDRYKDGRACLKGDISGYQEKVLATFDALPDFLQKRFCKLNKIYIEKDFFGSAWSGAVDESNPTRFLIGLRRSDFDANLDVGQYRTWFEQQSFGGKTDFSINSKLPIVHVIGKVVSSTTFTLLHELGHTLDYEFKYTISKNEAGFSKSWTHLSWRDIQLISRTSDFEQRKNICLNRCHGRYLDADRAGEFYQNLFSHGFLSQLAATNAMEDFADSFAFYVARKYMGLEFTVEANGWHFNISETMSGLPFGEKMQYLSDRF